MNEEIAERLIKKYNFLEKENKKLYKNIIDKDNTTINDLRKSDKALYRLMGFEDCLQIIGYFIHNGQIVKTRKER